MGPMARIEFLLDKLRQTKTNNDFFELDEYVGLGLIEPPTVLPMPPKQIVGRPRRLAFALAKRRPAAFHKAQQFGLTRRVRLIEISPQVTLTVERAILSCAAASAASALRQGPSGFASQPC